MLYAEEAKVKNCSFWTNLVLSFSHLDICILASHVVKLAKLLFFEADNIAILFFSFFVLFLLHIKLPNILHIFCFRYIDTYFNRKNSLNLKQTSKPKVSFTVMCLSLNQFSNADNCEPSYKKIEKYLQACFFVI